MTRLEELIKELPPEIKQKTAYILEYFLQKRTLQTQSPQKPVPSDPSLEKMGESEFRDKGQRIAMARSELVRLYRREVALAPKGKKMAAKHKFVGAYKLGYYPQLYAILRKTSWQTLERWHLKLRETGDPFDLAPKWGKNQDKTKVTPEQQRCLKDAAPPPYDRTVSELVRVGKEIMTAQGVDDTCCVRTYIRFLEKWRMSHRVPGSKPAKQK